MSLTETPTPKKVAPLPKMVLMFIAPVGIGRFAGDKIDKCAICRNDLMALCGGCSINQTEQSECTMVVGGCGHPFHFHCDSHMRKKNPELVNCIVCNVLWVLAKIVNLAASASESESGSGSSIVSEP